MNPTNAVPVAVPLAKTSSKLRRRRLSGLLLIALFGWLAYDLYAPRRTSLREFDPVAVAHLETRMWRSYYDKERFALFTQLAALLRRQYRMPLARSYVTAYHAARAAFVFKAGQNVADYEKVLPNLRSYYAAIMKMSDTPFDVESVARLELKWWIIHRQRAQHLGGDLDQALAELQAAIFMLPAERFNEHARLRAEAMLIRDQKAAQGGVTETDWQRIDQLLVDSWNSLWKAVH